MFLRLLRGALVTAGRKAPVLGTAQLVLDWHDLGRRAEAKRRLMLDCFEAASDDLLKEDNG